MPKISNNRIAVSNDLVTKHFDVEIYYNQSEMFYALIPESFNDAFDHMTDADRKLFKASLLYKSRRDRFSGKGGKRIVSASTEGDALSTTKKLIEKLIETEIKLRKVIVVFFNNRTTNFNNHNYTAEYPSIALQLGLTFCTEATVQGGKPNYYIYEEKEWFGEMKKNKREVHIYTDSCVIIDDTEENRSFTTGLYSALSTLVNKLNEFTATPEKLMELIGSQQKLLG